MCRHAIAVLNDIIYLLGGEEVRLKNDVWYSEDGREWQLANPSSPWAARACFSSVSFQDRIWLFGGRDSLGLRNDVWYSEDGRVWFETPSPPWERRRCYGSIVFENKIWLLGGNAYIPKNDIWFTTGLGVNEENKPSFAIEIFPNPFKDRVSIRWEKEDYEITVYNTLGKKIKRLKKGERSWDGRDGFGRNTSKGIYLLFFQSENRYSVKKILKIE